MRRLAVLVGALIGCASGGGAGQRPLPDGTAMITSTGARQISAIAAVATTQAQARTTTEGVTYYL
jgi:hypothetical protein